MAQKKDQAPTEVQRCLKGADYPADKRKLVDVARRNGADPQVVDLLQKLPGERYDSPAEVMKAYGKTK